MDMNLLPEWVPLLQNAGWSAVHGSSFGDPKAEDQAILGWALKNGHVVLTHDLDFGTALAPTHAYGPSVVQIRSQHLLPERAGPPAIAALRRFQPELIAGALLVIEPGRSRARFLPL